VVARREDVARTGALPMGFFSVWRPESHAVGMCANAHYPYVLTQVHQASFTNNFCVAIQLKAGLLLRYCQLTSGACAMFVFVDSIAVIIETFLPSLGTSRQ
jgi:hypothetical protein